MWKNCLGLKCDSNRKSEMGNVHKEYKTWGNSCNPHRIWKIYEVLFPETIKGEGCKFQLLWLNLSKSLSEAKLARINLTLPSKSQIYYNPQF